MRFLTALVGHRLWAVALALVAVFAAVAWLTDDKSLILVLTMMQIALAANVVIAFVPYVYAIAVGKSPMDKVSTLILGIWVAWFAVLYRAAESLVWRLLGQPAWLVNSDITSAYLALGCVAALLHIATPGSLHSDVPPRRWIQIGAVVGLAIFIGLVLVYADEVSAIWHGTGPPHSLAEPRWIG